MSKKKNPKRESISAMFIAFGGQQTILTIPRPYLDLCQGSHLAALLLSQIVFWSDRTDDEEGWFSHSYEEWLDELCLSDYQVKRLIEGDKRSKETGFCLKDIGVETKLRRSKHHEFAATLHYRINLKIFTYAIEKHFLSKPDSYNVENVDSYNVENDVIENVENDTTKNIAKTIAKESMPNGAQPRNAMYDAIHQVWGYEAGRNGDVSNWLSGKKCKAQYKDYLIDPMVTPDELIAWSKDWRDKHPGIDMVESPAKVQDSILKWRRWKVENIQNGQRIRAELEADIAINLAARGIVL